MHVEVSRSGAAVFHLGSSVQIIGGPFAGQIGVLSDLGPDGSAHVAITLVGEKVVVRIRTKDLSP